MDVDLVYTWVDGEDARWLQKREEAVGRGFSRSEANSKSRYLDNDELKYSLRSVDQYLSWIRRIFIITDEQTPEWLNLSHPKVEIVDHTQIMEPEILPCFNSTVIEYYLYKIPSLSECFLYANDDFFINSHLRRPFFFNRDGEPIVRLKKKPLGKWHTRLKYLIGKRPGLYREKIERMIGLVQRRFGKYYSGVPHHNIDAYRKSVYKKTIEEVFPEEVERSKRHQIRKRKDFHRSAIDFYTLATNQADLEYVNRKKSLRNQIYRDNARKRVEKYHPALFCMNDNQKATTEDRQEAKKFLDYRFPKKSSFEK